MSTRPPLTLYVHLPWCVRKCPYCDFNSHAARAALPEDDYVTALLRDLEQEWPNSGGRPIETIFLGGGTPSLFSPESIARLIRGIRERADLHTDAEITLEANPGAAEAAIAPSLARGPRLDPIGDPSRFQGYRAAGVNRLSIGIQSFDDTKLKALGRIHGSAEALAAAKAARAAGFDNFNLDLMFGLPDQSVADAIADVETALSLAPAHLSTYQLTIEPNTLFHAQPPTLPDDDRIDDMQEAIGARLTAAGYRHYEVSAWAKPGRECRHNLNYWQFGDYLGIGAGAHGKITTTGDAQGRASAAGGRTPGAAVTRRWKVKHPDAYLATVGTAAAIGGETRPAGRELAFEFLLNALRLNEGFTDQLFRERAGLDLELIRPSIERALARGLLIRDAHGIRPSEHGARFLNDLLVEFLPPAGAPASSSRTLA
ncbi:MAG: radical SAM family heme chaperone HemW [Pseudomonadota bacterium]